MIACFLSNISAKYYKNQSMLSRVIGENVGDVFLRNSVFNICCFGTQTPKKTPSNGLDWAFRSQISEVVK